MNAPIGFATQQRMVTAEDYKAIILENYSSVLDDVAAWGGNDNIPAVYGRVYVSLKFKDGMINLIAHDTTMEIPINNTLGFFKKNKTKFKKINLNKLNNLQLSDVDKKQFPITKLLNYLPSKDSLFETILVSTNDYLVDLLLRKKITYLELIEKLFKIVTKKEFNKYKLIEPKKITDILNIHKNLKSIIIQNEKNL